MIIVNKIILFLLLLCTSSVIAQTYEKHYFKGKLNNKIPVEIAWYTTLNDGDWVTMGYIYYPNAKNPAPILIVGESTKISPKEPNYDNLDGLKFTEYQPDGTITGRFTILWYEVEDDCTFYKGTWTNPTTGKSLPMTPMQATWEKPSWVKSLPPTLFNPKRDAWTFKYKLGDKDGDWYSTISVDFLKSGAKQLDLSFTADLCGAVNDDIKNALTWVTEEDINFDGIPDVMVYIGTSTRAQSIYKAYVWNPQTRQFYYVEPFEEIQEPDIDKATKTITSYVRDHEGMYIEKWKWKNGKLTMVSSKKELAH